MPKDALLSITGPADDPTNPVEAAAITADADGTKGYRYVGKYASGYVECRIAGAFDRADTNESIAFEIHEATDASGTGATRIASSAALTAGHRAALSASAADGKAAGSLSDGPVRVGYQTGAGGWIKVRFNVEGTSPSAAGVSVDIVPLGGAFQASGV